MLRRQSICAHHRRFNLRKKERERRQRVPYTKAVCAHNQQWRLHTHSIHSAERQFNHKLLNLTESEWRAGVQKGMENKNRAAPDHIDAGARANSNPTCRVSSLSRAAAYRVVKNGPLSTRAKKSCMLTEKRKESVGRA